MAHIQKLSAGINRRYKQSSFCDPCDVNVYMIASYGLQFNLIVYEQTARQKDTLSIAIPDSKNVFISLLIIANPHLNAWLTFHGSARLCECCHL